MEVRLIVDNRARIPIANIGRECIAALKGEFEHENKHRQGLRRMGVAGWWSEPELLRTWRADPPANESGLWLSFPRGGTGRVAKILATAGYDVVTVDNREHGVPVKLPDSTRHLYPYQRRIVEMGLHLEQCLVRAPAGSGKTSALIALASLVGLPTLVVVPTKALLSQWRERVHDELGLPDRQIGQVSGGKYKLRPITLAVQLSVTKHATTNPEFRDYFGCVLMDEVHTAPANTAFVAIDAMPARYRIGASADVKRKDQKECLMQDLFGEVAIDIDRDALIASGHILDAEACIVLTEFEASWYGVRDVDDAEDDRQVDFVRLVREMSEDGERNMQAVRIIRDEVTRGNQVLVMAHLREHCMQIAQMIGGMGTPTGLLLGGDESASEFARTSEGLKSGKIRVGVGTYKAIGTGIDLPRVAIAVAVTPILANRQFFGQVRGRVCRTSKGKTGAKLYLLVDHRVFPRHVANAAAWNAQTVVQVGAEWQPARQWIKSMRVGLVG